MVRTKRKGVTIPRAIIVMGTVLFLIGTVGGYEQDMISDMQLIFRMAVSFGIIFIA